MKTAPAITMTTAQCHLYYGLGKKTAITQVQNINKSKIDQ